MEHSGTLGMSRDYLLLGSFRVLGLELGVWGLGV